MQCRTSASAPPSSRSYAAASQQTCSRVSCTRQSAVFVPARPSQSEDLEKPAMSSTFDDGAGSDVEGSSQRENSIAQPDGKKRKRNRQALNCNMCRARKVQCDRRRPACTACIKRGTAGECKWEDKGADPPAQTFALETVVDR